MCSSGEGDDSRACLNARDKQSVSSAEIHADKAEAASRIRCKSLSVISMRMERLPRAGVWM